MTGAEIYLEHYKAQLRQQVDVEPGPADPAAGGRRDRRGVLPAVGEDGAAGRRPALYTANGLLGEYFHARGVARKPGGWRLWSYNLPMGPPISAPGLMAMVGGMGLLAAVLRREQ